VPVPIGTTNANTPRDMAGEVVNWDDRLPEIQLAIDQHNKNNQIIFMGDSITERWTHGQAEGLPVWNEFYVDQGRSPMNFGIGGDVTHGLLYRIIDPDGSYSGGPYPGAFHLEHMDPKLAVILIGTNNYLAYTPNDSAADTAGGILACADIVRTLKPTCKVLICSVLPRSSTTYDTLIDDTNAIVEADALIDGVNVMYIDLHPVFLDPGTGEPDLDLFVDGTHLSEAGYRVWAEQIEPIVAAVLAEGSPPPKFVMAKGAVATGTSTGLIDVALDLNGETPAAFWVRTIGRADQMDANGIGDVHGSYGFGRDAGPTGQGHHAWRIMNNVNPTQCGRTQRLDSILTSLDSSDVVDGRMVVNATHADFIQFEVTDAFPRDTTFEVVAIAGSDIANVSLAFWNLASGTGTQNIASLTHGSDYVEHLGSILSGNNQAGAGCIFMLGRAYIPQGSNQVLCFSADDGVATTNTRRYSNDAESGAAAFSSGPLGRFTTGPSLVNGFQINRIESVGGTARPMISFVIQGTFRCSLYTTATATDATPVIGDPGFVPVLTHLISHGTSESTIDAIQDGAEFSFGSFAGQFGTGPSGAALSAQGFRHSDAAGAATNHTSTFTEFDAVYAKLDASGNLDGVMTIVEPGSPPPTAWTGDMVNPDPAPSLLLAASFGESPSGGGGSGSFRRVPRSWLNRNLVRLAA
jgi:lysophospholipase L1-like esterase